MKFQVIFFFGIICILPLLEAKRMPGVTRSRNKNNKPSVRRNTHGHEYDDNPLPPVKPKAPEIKKSAPSATNPSAPVGPPPAYTGMGHHAAPSAYNPSYSNPPSHSYGFNQQRFTQMPYSQPGGVNQHQHGGYNQFNSPGLTSQTMMPMGVSPYGYGNRNSGLGSGIMTNLFAGLAGYQLAKAFNGGGHHYNRDREIIVIDNRQPESSKLAQITHNDQTHVVLSSSDSNMSQYSTEIPQIPVTQVIPTMNEYNYWGFPQYGVPLYGYSLPTQITDYYQTVISKLP